MKIGRSLRPPWRDQLAGLRLLVAPFGGAAIGCGVRAMRWLEDRVRPEYRVQFSSSRP